MGVGFFMFSVFCDAKAGLRRGENVAKKVMRQERQGRNAAETPVA
jgi:hypothetical protein